MEPNSPPAADDAFYDLLSQLDDALATGGPLPELLPADFSLRQRLSRHLTVLQQLRLEYPARDSAGTIRYEALKRPSVNESTFGRFHLRRELGRGGFGIVYLADDPTLGRPVALKVPRVEALTDANLRSRFLREARAAATLDHPNLGVVHVAGEVGPVCYIASAYCPGPNLAQWLKLQQSLVTPRTAALVMATLADGIQHAHERGVLHRDLKPSNILMTEEPGSEVGFRPRIVDFGLAKLVEADDQNTATGAIVGTPAYMAPEQAAGEMESVGPAADIYSLGAILYEMLTERPPFKGPTTLSTLDQVRQREPIAPSKLHAELPRDLEVICLKCLEKEPSERYPAAAVLRDDLRRFLNGDPIQAQPPSFWARLERWSRRPERIPQAGLAMLTQAITYLFYSAMLVLAVSTGLLKVEDHLAFWTMGCVALSLYLPMVWLGWRTLHRKRSTVWLAGVFSFAQTAALATVTFSDGHMGLGEKMTITHVLANCLITAVSGTVFLFQVAAWRAARASGRG